MEKRTTWHHFVPLFFFFFFFFFFPLGVMTSSLQFFIILYSPLTFYSVMRCLPPLPSTTSATGNYSNGRWTDRARHVSFLIDFLSRFIYIYIYHAYFRRTRIASARYASSLMPGHLAGPDLHSILLYEITTGGGTREIVHRSLVHQRAYLFCSVLFFSFFLFFFFFLSFLFFKFDWTSKIWTIWWQFSIAIAFPRFLSPVFEYNQRRNVFLSEVIVSVCIEGSTCLRILTELKLEFLRTLEVHERVRNSRQQRSNFSLSSLGYFHGDWSSDFPKTLLPRESSLRFAERTEKLAIYKFPKWTFQRIDFSAYFYIQTSIITYYQCNS